MRFVFVFVVLFLAYSCTALQYWVEQAIQYQLDIQRDVPLNDVVLLASHNSYSRPNSTYTGDPDKAPVFENQVLSLAEQMNLGARILEMDIHWILNSPYTEKLWNCHSDTLVYYTCFNTTDAEVYTICSIGGLVNYRDNTGCYLNYDRTVRQNMQEISDWLQANQEFLIVYFEWDVDPSWGGDTDASSTELQQILTSIFGPKIFTPGDRALASNWPSLNELFTLGKRIAFHGPFPFNSTLMFQHVANNEWVFGYRHIKDFVPSSCTNSLVSGSPPLNDFFYFQEDSGGWLNTLVNQADDVGLYNETTAREALNCGFNVKFDQIDYDKNKWIVWSWAENEPVANISSNPLLSSDYCAYLDGKTGRWHAQQCDAATYNFACRDTTNQTNNWILSASTANGHKGITACTLPTTYTFPTNPLLNLALFNLAAGKNVWIRVAASNAALPPNPTPVAPSPSPSPPPPPPPTDRPSPQEPRFCGLPATATTLDCNAVAYAQSIVNRNLGPLIFVAICFVISFIFGCMMLLFACGCCGVNVHKKKGPSLEDDEVQDDYVLLGRRCCTKPKHYIVILFVLLVIAGSITLSNGNDQTNGVFTTTNSLLNEKVTLIYTAIELANDTLTALWQDAKTTLGSDFSLNQADLANIQSAVLAGFADAKKNVDFFTYWAGQANYGRNIFIMFIIIVPPILTFLAFLMLRFHRSISLILILLLINFFVFCCLVTYVVHSILATAGKDVCEEISYKDGLFDLFQAQLNIALTKVYSISNDTIGVALNKGCAAYDTACGTGLKIWACRLPCNEDYLLKIGNFTVIDSDFSIKSLSDCSVNCIDPELKSGTGTLTLYLTLLSLTNQLLAAVQSVYDGLASDESRATFSYFFCTQVSSALVLMYTGAAMTLVGALVTVILIACFRWKRE